MSIVSGWKSIRIVSNEPHEPQKPRSPKPLDRHVAGRPCVIEKSTTSIVVNTTAGAPELR
jgi:hypothetical protein